jgi:glutamate carboxypeptidase
MPGRATTPEATLRHFRGRSEEMLDVLERLVLIESPTGDVAGIEAFVRSLALLLESAGVSCREIPGPGGPHLVGEAIPARETGPPIVLVGHSDTVWPRGEVTRRPPRVEEGRLHGPGVYDMRAGLTSMVFALEFLNESGRSLSRRIQVFLSADEEVGSVTAHPHMEALFPPSAAALVLEPPCPDGALKAWRKGVGMYDLHVTGRESHAGNDPEAGVNAILELAHQILAITAWSDPSRGVTLNIGEARGGVATNMVAGSATAGVDLRFERMEDGEAVDRRLKSLGPVDPRAGIAVSGGIIFPPLSPDKRSRRIQDVAIAAAGELGVDLARGKAGGGSDGSFLASRGLAVIDGLGVEGGGAHAREEHIVIERLPWRAAFLSRLILALNAEPA